MRAGFGKCELTPPLGVELAGYGYYLGRRAQSVRDPLYARAVLLEGDKTSLIISCDVLGLSRQVCGEVFSHAEKLGIPASQVMIVSIHTHTGPAIKYHEGCGEVNNAYVATVGSLICRAVDEAIADLNEVVKLQQSCIQFTSELIYNRAASDGPVDRFVRGFILERKGCAPIGLISTACHGVFRKRTTAISADFAGEINRQMEAQGIRSIYLNGLCGDIDPYQPSDERLTAFADLVVKSFNKEKTSLPLHVDAGELPFSLRLMPVSEDDIRAVARRAVSSAGGPQQPAARVALVWEREMLENFANLKETENITCKYVVLGGVPILAIPFEGFTRIGQDIRQLIGRQDALVLGCAEELLGYLPTKDDIARGAYAALESTFLYKRLPVVPGEAERLALEIGNSWERVLAWN